MLDIELFRKTPDVVRKSQMRRRGDLTIVDKIIDTDNKWREALSELNELRRQRNLTAKAISELKKSGKDASEMVSNMKGINSQIKNLEDLSENLKSQRDEMLMSVPNLLDSSVPDGEDEEDNQPIRTWGRCMVQGKHLDRFKEQTGGLETEFKVIDREPKSHVDILNDLGLADFPRAAKVAGARFYYLKGDMVLLDMALQRFALDFMSEKGYTIVNPPYMLTGEAYRGVTDLGTFQDTLYKIEGEDLYVIATAEHPLAAMYMNEIIEMGDLPIKMAGISPCFRKEAGAHGKDTKGIFRVHQFNKIEQFAYSTPDQSWDIHEEMIRNAEEMFQALGIPYRVVNVCSGDLGAVASKKYDLEAWMPVQGTYREMVSASNVLDYQARRLNIRYRTKDGTRYPHMINSTALATSRVMVAIMENYQSDDGEKIIVPEALRKYTGFDTIEKKAIL